MFIEERTIKMTLNPILTHFTVVDVETPNAYQNSICSIAILHVENNHITFAKEYLVNPQARFDNMNMSIHHITPEMVENEPTFPSVWNEIKHFFTNEIAIAHNATFDLRVISKTLASYDIAVPDFSYICTLKKARRHISKEVYGSHKLNVLCDAYHIDLDNHHDAMCDTKACKSLFELFAIEYGIQDSDIELFSLNVKGTTVSTKKSPVSAKESPVSAKKSPLQKAVNSNLWVQNPELDLTSKVCCLTGTFSNGAKSDVEAFIICKGGTCITGLNQKVDYLVVGGQGSSNWKYGNYGAKVSKAVQMQEKGIVIHIISEEVLYIKQ